LHYSLLSTNEEWQFTNQGNNHNIEVSGSLSANNGDVLKDAAIAGIGIALLPTFIAQDALASGQLKRILNEFEPEPLGLYAVKLSRKFTPARVTKLIEYLKEVFA
jgi:DNA-binding transcriptional LysR family regulator